MEAVDSKLQSLEQTMDTRLAKIEEQNTQIMLALQKKKGGTFFVSYFFIYLCIYHHFLKRHGMDTLSGETTQGLP